MATRRAILAYPADGINRFREKSSGLARGSGKSSFLMLSANTPWVYALARGLAEHGAVTAVRFYDWMNYRRLRPQWPETQSAMRRVSATLPPGYAGRLEPLFRPLVGRMIGRERARLRELSGMDPIVVCPYPYLAPWVRGIPDDRLVYYNLDEYTFYQPSRSRQILQMERELVGRSRLVACLSANQVETLAKRYPESAAKIRHFPLGLDESFLNPAVEDAPVPDTVGYVGNFTDRVDWGFVAAVADLVPEAKFHFVGRLETEGVGTTDTSWIATRTKALSRPNVVYEGVVPQAAVREHYWRYAVNWMPYDIGHGFNIAACPTKIMDALASGRPFVSTDLPEVRLHPEKIHIVRTPEDAAISLRLLLNGKIRHDADGQLAFASEQTWPHRAVRLLELLSL